MSQKKIAIIAFNLGGPDHLDSVEPFLFNLFHDKAIIALPQPFRYLIAKLISRKRKETAKEIYQQMGGKSPIVELTNQQLEALETLINQSDVEVDYKCFLAMRYWHPMAEDALEKVRAWQPDEMVLLPLYPQFSTTTSESSINQWNQLCKKQNYHIPTTTIGCYPTEEHFIDAHVSLIEKEIEKVKDKPYRLLFSAHGLPKKVIDAGDPYQWQVEQTSHAVMEKLKKLYGENIDYQVCYQSKVGPLEWIGPATDSEIERAAKEGKAIILVPIAFVSEHSETLVELDIEYKELAEVHGCHTYLRAPALGSETEFIHSLKNIITSQKNKFKTISYCGKRICPEKFRKCICLGQK